LFELLMPHYKQLINDNFILPNKHLALKST